MRNFYILLMLSFCLLQSCASKKDILYFQDIAAAHMGEIDYKNPKIQINDILSVKVSALMPETAAPYNIGKIDMGSVPNVETLKLQGYLVADDGTIKFPILGDITATEKTTSELEIEIQSILKDEGHIKDPVVRIRILNSKITIIGEVNKPGTYNFTEQNITLPQALGYAGDLTINGERKDILIIREEDNVRNVGHIDLTRSDWFESPYYYVKQNDVIVVNPNGPKVKSAGFIGNAGNVLTIVSLLLSTVVLLTR